MDKKNIYTTRKAYFEYEIGKTYTAGIILQGGEIKSLRQGETSIKEAFCFINELNQLVIKNMYIKPAAKKNQTIEVIDATRERVLLVTGDELKKLKKDVEQKGNTIIPLEIFIEKNGKAKLKIGIATGRKKHDKRQAIKEKDISREQERVQKYE